MSIKKIISGILERTYICFGCKKKAELNYYGFCRDCFRDILLIENLPGKDVYHVLRYEGPIKKIISDFKYSGKKYYGKRLAKMAASCLKENMVEGFDFIVPVPLHWRKEFLRGFNQSAVVSVHLGRIMNKKALLNVLVKAENTKSQTMMGKNERNRNILNSFTVKKRHLIKGKRVLLLDDVYTTGATANEAKKVLMSAGAAKVIVLTIAKA
ncbi:MAG TPA: ComF family protein [bacterium]|nr:ComF family protein [bacterium]